MVSLLDMRQLHLNLINLCRWPSCVVHPGPTQKARSQFQSARKKSVGSNWLYKLVFHFVSLLPLAFLFQEPVSDMEGSRITETENPPTRTTMDIKITHVVSPNRIHFQPVKMLPDVEKSGDSLSILFQNSSNSIVKMVFCCSCFRLQKDLMAEYADKTPDESTTWAVGSVCVIQHSEDKQFYRGFIKEMSSDSVKVFIPRFPSVDVCQICRVHFEEN